MKLTEAQRETVEGISPKGIRPNSGTPCECGAERYSTREEHGYSDFITFYHRCGSCGNKFSTFIEG